MVGITGANGYLGGRIAQRLDRAGIEVLALVRRPEQWSGPGQARAYDGVTHLVHAAYDTRATGARIVHNNVAGSLALIEAARARGARIVLISSLSAFAGTRSRYGASKLQLEAIVRERSGVILRPGLVFGKDAGGLFGTLVRVIARAPAIVLPGGGRQRQFLTYDRTLAELIELIARERFAPTRPVFAACEAQSSLRAIVEAIAAAQGRRPAIIDLPTGALAIGARLAELAGATLPLRSDSLLSLMRPIPLDQVAMLERSPLAFPPLSAQLWAS
jgi:nucleoside-diphosphate-sugar epimerase